MKKIKKIMATLLVALLLLTLNILLVLNSVQAVNINSANIHSGGDCGSLLKYNGTVVKCYYAQYSLDGQNYPAYCLDKTKQGVTNEIQYGVSVEDAIQDVTLWRYVINGYPYKSISELGCSNKEEAFTATKQAIYCYIHGNNINAYEAIGEAGARTLNALNKIVSDAQNSNETRISNTITINKNVDTWAQDSIDKNYLSKTYSITAKASITNYKISLSKAENELPEGIKITDEKNSEKSEFSPSEKFKVLVPIKNLKQAGNFNLKVEAKIKTKPVLYGKAGDGSYQDYALTAATYEDGNGNANDTYAKNETKIIVLKLDKDTKEKLQNVEFQLLDSNKQVVYQNLKTNSEGKIVIENLVPGTYYLKEINTLDGYLKYDELIEVSAKWNQVVTATVNNSKEEVVEVKVDNKELEVEQESKKQVTVETTSSKEIRKLPVTGM